jgi:hypothetical protein
MTALQYQEYRKTIPHLTPESLGIPVIINHKIVNNKAITYLLELFHISNNQESRPKKVCNKNCMTP